MHDFNPGILQSGLFWTMQIPDGSFTVNSDGSRARLRVADLPIPDTFFFSNNVSVAAEIDVDVRWRANSAPVTRGFGDTVPSDDFGAFLDEFSDAAARGTGGGRETGFSFTTGGLDASGFFAELGYERNGVFL